MLKFTNLFILIICKILGLLYSYNQIAPDELSHFKYLISTDINYKLLCVMLVIIIIIAILIVTYLSISILKLLSLKVFKFNLEFNDIFTLVTSIMIITSFQFIWSNVAEGSLMLNIFLNPLFILSSIYSFLFLKKKTHKPKDSLIFSLVIYSLNIILTLLPLF